MATLYPKRAPDPEGRALDLADEIERRAEEFGLLHSRAVEQVPRPRSRGEGLATTPEPVACPKTYVQVWRGTENLVFTIIDNQVERTTPCWVPQLRQVFQQGDVHSVDWALAVLARFALGKLPTRPEGTPYAYQHPGITLGNEAWGRLHVDADRLPWFIEGIVGEWDDAGIARPHMPVRRPRRPEVIVREITVRNEGSGYAEPRCQNVDVSLTLIQGDPLVAGYFEDLQRANEQIALELSRSVSDQILRMLGIPPRLLGDLPTEYPGVEEA